VTQCEAQRDVRSIQYSEPEEPIREVGEGGAHCFHMEVKMAVLNVISQNYNFFEVKLVPYASLCLGNYLDQIFVKF
jgi:hypothetical protein